MPDLSNSWGASGRVVAWWSNWVRGQLAADELRRCARDVGNGELIALAEQGLQAVVLLYRRLRALGIDAAALCGQRTGGDALPRSHLYVLRKQDGVQARYRARRGEPQLARILSKCAGA